MYTDLSNPKPGHTTGGSGRGSARRGNGPARGWIGRTPFGRPGKETALVLALQRIEKTLVNFFSEERTV